MQREGSRVKRPECPNENSTCAYLKHLEDEAERASCVVLLEIECLAAEG